MQGQWATAPDQILQQRGMDRVWPEPTRPTLLAGFVLCQLIVLMVVESTQSDGRWPKQYR